MSAVGVVTNINPDDILGSIWERVITPRPDCKLWANAVDRGYGRIAIGGTVYRVHRVVWELTKGPIPEGMTIDHLCRVRNCLNVEHMELVTDAENSRRATPYRPRRAPVRTKPLKTHCIRDHEYTPENTSFDNRGNRRCRECQRLRDATRPPRNRKREGATE